jgi:hypothetical protein
MSAEQNKALVRHLLEEVWRGNLDILNQHPGMHDSILFLKQLAESVDFSKREMVQQLTDGDWVVTRFVSAGTNIKDFMGMPVGMYVQMEMILMHQIQNGMIVKQHAHGGRIE